MFSSDCPEIPILLIMGSAHVCTVLPAATGIACAAHTTTSLVCSGGTLTCLFENPCWYPSLISTLPKVVLYNMYWFLCVYKIWVYYKLFKKNFPPPCVSPRLAIPNINTAPPNQKLRLSDWTYILRTLYFIRRETRHTQYRYRTYRSDRGPLVDEQFWFFFFC